MKLGHKRIELISEKSLVMKFKKKRKRKEKKRKEVDASLFISTLKYHHKP